MLVIFSVGQYTFYESYVFRIFDFCDKSELISTNIKNRYIAMYVNVIESTPDIGKRSPISFSYNLNPIPKRRLRLSVLYVEFSDLAFRDNPHSNVLILRTVCQQACSGPQPIQHPRKRDGLADVFDAGHPGGAAFDAHAEAGVGDAAVASQI